MFFIISISIESCLPEFLEDNKCYVINGGVVVGFEDGDDPQIIKSNILQSTREGMENDEFLSPEYPEIVKITFIDDKNLVDRYGNGEELSEGAGSNKMVIGLASGLTAGFLVLLFAVVKKRRKNRNAVGHTELSEIKFPYDLTDKCVPTCFIAPDPHNLGKRSSNMNVHHCTSSTCNICYLESNLAFCASTPMSKAEQELEVVRLQNQGRTSGALPAFRVYDLSSSGTESLSFEYTHE